MERSLQSLAMGLLVCFFTAVATPSARAAVVEGDRATFTWQPASGPVAGYNVFVIRNGVAGAAPELGVSAPTATVTSQVNDTISIQVAAFDASGNQGPLSASSEAVLLTAAAPPPYVTVGSTSDFSIQNALAMAAPGEQVIAHLNGDAKQLLDAGLDPASGIPEDQWGLDQLVVGDPGQPATVRLVDAVGLDSQVPLSNLPQVTLFGLGNGAPCQRDGGEGLVIHDGSLLILGGVDLFAFDGQSCVYVNDLFAQSPTPNRIGWGAGEIQLHGDLEDDGVLDPDDNCLLVENLDQCDGDRDGFGSACDFDVNGDGAVGLEDLGLVHAAMRQISADPTLDLDCDGYVGMDDLGNVLANEYAVPGPSGLACAADGSCFSP